MRQPQLHLLIVHLRTRLQLWQARGRLRQPQLHLLVVHLRSGLFLRHLTHQTGGSSRYRTRRT